MSSLNASNMYNDLKTELMKVVNDDNTLIGKLFKYLENKLGFKRSYILLAMLCILALYMVVGYGLQFLSNIIGFIYPAYASMAAIESPDSRDDTKWLTYWVVFSLFAILEYPFAFILSYIPFYFLIKCLLFAWLFLPVMNGSSVIYSSFIRPFFMDVKKDVKDSIAKSVAAGVTNVLKSE